MKNKPTKKQIAERLSVAELHLRMVLKARCTTGVMKTAIREFLWGDGNEPR